MRFWGGFTISTRPIFALPIFFLPVQKSDLAEEANSLHPSIEVDPVKMLFSELVKLEQTGSVLIGAKEKRFLVRVKTVRILL